MVSRSPPFSLIGQLGHACLSQGGISPLSFPRGSRSERGGAGLFGGWGSRSPGREPFPRLPRALGLSGPGRLRPGRVARVCSLLERRGGRVCEAPRGRVVGAPEAARLLLSRAGEGCAVRACRPLGSRPAGWAGGKEGWDTRASSSRGRGGGKLCLAAGVGGARPLQSPRSDPLWPPCRGTRSDPSASPSVSRRPGVSAFRGPRPSPSPSPTQTISPAAAEWGAPPRRRHLLGAIVSG